jgi:methyl acetate hydrolase
MLIFDPGDRREYGINMDWVGKMMEALNRKKLGGYLSEKIFSPSVMKDTAFNLTPAMLERLAKIHECGNDGSLTPIKVEMGDVGRLIRNFG